VCTDGNEWCGVSQRQRFSEAACFYVLTASDLCIAVQENNLDGTYGLLLLLMGKPTYFYSNLLLQDVIALRKRSGTISGNIFLNGWEQDPISFRRCSGYVEQFDVQSPELTVRETVLFSARLRLDPNIVKTDEERYTFVDQILQDMELSDLENALVGTEEDVGLSFEQKKRLSIAVELAASPSVLFLDEPTSGLDARSALLVVRLLRKISDSGRTCVATVRFESWRRLCFEEVIVLLTSEPLCI
jgi:ABC-type multidrug transport system ATPase subunit